MGKRCRILSIAFQTAVIVFTAWSVGDMFLHTGSGNMRVDRYVIFRYFTVDSNILCALSCAVSLLWNCFGSAGGRKAVMLLRYAGTAAVAVTMMTVVLFLSFLYGFRSMFEGWNLWLHGLGPLLSILSFAFFERDGTVPEKKHLLIAALPVIVYGAVYLRMAILLGKDRGGWSDFYGFNMGGKWPLSYLGMVAGTVLIGAALKKLRAGRSTGARLTNPG